MTPSDLQPLVDWLNANPGWVLFSLGFVAFIESLALVGIVVPGVAILFVIAAVAGGADISLSHALIVGFIGAVLGDGISFYIGHYYRDRLTGVWPFSRFPKALDSGKDFFQKHGGKSVIIGRFVGPIRPVLPIVAGMMGMSQVRFIAFNLSSAVAWSPFYILPGYWSGAAVQQSFPDNFMSVIVSAILILGLLLLGFRYASQGLQQGSRWYELVEIKKASSPLFAKLWKFLSANDQSDREIPLASLSLLVIATSLFWFWTLINLHFDGFAHVDEAVFNLATQLRGDTADLFIISITLLGDENFHYFAFSLLFWFLIWKRQFLAAIHVTAAGYIASGLTHGLKSWFAVARPDFVMLPPSSLSYPSGHSSGAAVFWGLLASFVAQEAIRSKRWQVYVVLFIPMLLIALSRVVLGVHWFSDVVGGILLGLAICGLTRVSFGKFSIRYGTKPLNWLGENRKDLIIFATLWLAGAVTYQVWIFADAIAQLQLK